MVDVIRKLNLITTFQAILVLCSCKPGYESFSKLVSSPDNQVQLKVELKDNYLNYSVSYQGKEIIEPSSLKLDLEKPVENGFEVIDSKIAKENKKWSPVYGEFDEIKDEYQLLTVRIKEKGILNRIIDAEFRIYNEGIAFRYVFPEQEHKEWTILNESSRFKFAEGAKAYPIEKTEQAFSKIPVNVENIHNKVLTPLTVNMNHIFASVLEANVDDFPRMHLVNSSDSVLTSKLLGEAKFTTPFASPWRAVLLAKNEGGLIENESLVLNLNKECQIKDPSWIKPGKTVSGINSFPHVTKELKKLVDFADENGFKYVQLDWGWYGTEIKWKKEWIESFKEKMPDEYKGTDWESNTEANPFTVGKGVVPYYWKGIWAKRNVKVDLDIEELVRYGKSKDVGISLYVEAGRTLPMYDMDSLFATYQRWGVAGLKPGFVKYGRQEDTKWIREMVKTAAKYNLILCIHDAHVPDGFERTYPNLMISEGGGGNEKGHPAYHDVILPFTRCLVGAFDFTPNFYRKDKTNAHTLAFLVVYYAPAPTFRGIYAAMYGNGKSGRVGKEIDFIRNVPVSWDSTKVLNAKIGEYLTVARKSGNNWFVGGMNGETSRKITIGFDFLEKGKVYKAKIYSDDIANSSDGFCPVKIKEIEVLNADKLDIELAKAGGFTMELNPAENL